MQRDRPDSLVLMQDTDSVPPTRTLDARDFDFELQAGYEVELITRPGCSGWGLDIRYLSLQHDSANRSAAVTTTLLNPLRINNSVPTFVPNVSTVAANYDSSIRSGELNFWRPASENITFQLGFRYLELDEQLHTDLLGSAPPASYSTATRNRLYGGQLGADAKLLGFDKLRVDAFGKAGIYLNRSGQGTLLTNGVIAQSAGGQADKTSFVGETGLMGSYQVTPCWSIRGGYQLLWVSSAALASDQTPATNLLTGTGLDSSGDAFYHGGMLGIEFRR